MAEKMANREVVSISDGVNARPRNESIAQTAGGLPNDAGAAVEVDEAEVERIRDKLLGEPPEDEAEGHPS